MRETADASGVHRNSVITLESETTFPRHAWAADRIASAMEAAGISFDQTDDGLAVSFEARRIRTPAVKAALRERCFRPENSAYGQEYAQSL